jgi:hypothetical protein
MFKWTWTYIGLWVAGLTIAVLGMIATVPAISMIGIGTFLLSVVPYAFMMFRAYRVQNALNVHRLYKAGAWQIIVAGFITNPYIFGWYIPLSIKSVVKKCKSANPNCSLFLA